MAKKSETTIVHWEYRGINLRFSGIHQKLVKKGGPTFKVVR